MSVDIWYEKGSPLQRICFLEVRGGQGVLVGPCHPVAHLALVAPRTLLYQRAHIHPAEMKRKGLH